MGITASVLLLYIVQMVLQHKNRVLVLTQNFICLNFNPLF
ncbi:hypothetical protein GLYMA_20G144950v4 [Glycine max]|nr:hypothetical protein GLYMA_20G144950v4 [Glycine max]KAH1036109.1 hypothetical protein GYH30_055864 [Glycine max]